MLRKSLLLFVFIAWTCLAGCDESAKEDTLGVFLQTEEPGDNCEHGGVSARTPDSEIIYVCEGVIMFYTLDQFDREQRYYAILLTDARVIGIEEYTQGGSRFERVEMVFEEITHFWDKNGASATLYWDGPPAVK
ncbi:hypothetical protein KJ975_04150 [Myxococcota bacterium]|nr:hypothetical protein [Myxococcota bacterium]